MCTHTKQQSKFGFEDQMSNTHLAFGVNKEKQNMGDPCSFKLNSYINQFRSYNTRISQAYCLPYCRTNPKKSQAFFQGPQFSNQSFDTEVINSQSLSSFRKILKMKLLINIKTDHKSFIFYFSPSFLQLMLNSPSPYFEEA